jgi:hypothetical protein
MPYAFLERVPSVTVRRVNASIDDIRLNSLPVLRVIVSRTGNA